ncbi:MAG TPA: hypothetical protein VF411_10690 [Bacteroidia bacterium]
MSSGENFISIGNAPFDSWQRTFVIKVNLYKGGWAWNVDANNEWNTLTGAGNVKQARWIAAWAKVESKQFEQHDEVELIKAHAAYESGIVEDPTDTSIRIFIKRYIANNKHVTPEQKNDCGLTVPTGVITHPADPAIKTQRLAAMQLALKSMHHLIQVIEVIYPGTKSKKKPAGIKEVMMFLATQSATLTTTPTMDAFQYVGDVKRGNFTANFTAAQEAANLRAFYAVREKNNKGQFGNWSMVISVAVA